MATRVSRWLPLIRISRFTLDHPSRPATDDIAGALKVHEDALRGARLPMTTDYHESA
jgi:hypothetical protein